MGFWHRIIFTTCAVSVGVVLGGCEPSAQSAADDALLDFVKGGVDLSLSITSNAGVTTVTMLLVRGQS